VLGGLGGGLVGYGKTRSDTEGAAAQVFGALVATAGAASFVTGVVLWPLGASRMAEARKGGVYLGAAPAGSFGSSLQLRF
jgi:hypothetical protein